MRFDAPAAMSSRRSDAPHHPLARCSVPAQESGAFKGHRAATLAAGAARFIDFSGDSVIRQAERQAVTETKALPVLHWHSRCLLGAFSVGSSG